MPFELKWPFILEHPSDVTDLQFLIVRGVGFLLVTWLVVKWLWPSMIRPHLVDRERGIAESDAQVTDTLRETKEMRDDYQSRLQGIEEETEQRMTAAVLEAEQLSDTILAEARQTATTIVRRGEEEVARERAKAMVQLRNQFVNGVVGAAQHAARSLGEGDQRRLVEGFIKDLGAAS